MNVAWQFIAGNRVQPNARPVGYGMVLVKRGVYT
jgi:hypothetical protein